MKKKLSVSMRKGAKMAKELGIEQNTNGLLVSKDSQGQVRMCALGQALLPIVGKKELVKYAGAPTQQPLYDIIDKTFIGTKKESTCLINKYSEIIGRELTYENVTIPTSFTWNLNDNLKKTPEEIADYLAECGL